MPRQYEEMAVFAKVVEAGSFTRAAEMLGLPKSTVSTRVSRLEARLGVQLLQRSTRRLHLTAEGARYYAHCAHMVDVASRADSEIAGLQDRPTGVLRVTAPVNFGAALLCPLAADFLGLHPGLSIDFLLVDRVVNLIEEGVDLAFRVGPLGESNLVVRRLAPVRHHFCAAPSYVARHGIPEKPEDLAAHVCLPYPRGTWTFERDGERRTVRLESRLTANNLQGLERAALAGLGIVRLPEYMCGEAVRDGRFVTVLADWPEPPAEVHAVYPAARHLPVKVRRFLDHVVGRLG